MQDPSVRYLKNENFWHSAPHSYNDYEQFEELQYVIEKPHYSIDKFWFLYNNRKSKFGNAKYDFNETPAFDVQYL